MGTSTRPVFSTRPARAKTFVPLLFSVPIPAYHSPPLRMMGAMLAKVSTLLMSVGCAEQAFHGRIWRAGARRAALPFHRSDQSGFFAADEGAGTQTHIDAKAETRAADVGPEQAEAFGLANGVAQALDGQGIFGAHINVAFRRAHGVSRDQHAFEHAVGIAFEHAAIHERAGIAFVGVADDILLRAHRFRDRAPLQARGISRAAAAAQAAFGDLLDDFARRHFGERFDQRAVAVGGHVVFDAIGIDDAGIFQHDLFLPLKKWNIGGADQARDGRAVQAVEDRSAVGGFHLLIEHPALVETSGPSEHSPIQPTPFTWQ